MNYCIYCGTKISADNKFCPQCGKPIFGHPVNTDQEPEEETAGGSSNKGNGEKGVVELSEADKKRLKEEMLKEMMNKNKKGE